MDEKDINRFNGSLVADDGHIRWISGDTFYLYADNRRTSRCPAHVQWFIHHGEWPEPREQLKTTCPFSWCLHPDHLYRGRT